MSYEPSGFEVFITQLVGDLASGVYKAYVDRLPLMGNENVIELGPASGNSTRHLAERLLKGGGRVTAIDISQVWTGVARKRLVQYANVELLCGDMATLVPNESFDAAFMNFVLHDIPGPERGRVMQSLVNKLRPGGKLFLREPLDRISGHEIRTVLEKTGLREVDARVTSVPLQGKTYEGVFVK